MMLAEASKTAQRSKETVNNILVERRITTPFSIRLESLSTADKFPPMADKNRSICSLVRQSKRNSTV
jgi:hypothetical protein